ncbi:hypothetical protein SAMN05421640_3480 [Ekhidna lutea]|uniref:Uncharacterized protein n=1 Tax=Ekhidna lutea TaxID=447679 RepID=A0A239LXB2_EKHLU|nr:hypothetical protein [Ekhidna lutea]SNT35297.1 hypothetical protein SAMN05421640_3480 [Ekhidna lutea]
MKVLWYNNTLSSYQTGSWNDFKKIATGGLNHEILPLEKFNNASETTLNKIVKELNKCRSSHKK